MSIPFTENEEVRYEPRDVRLRPLLAAGGAVLALVVVAGAAMAGLLGWLTEHSPHDKLEVSGALPQVEILRQRDALRQREDELLSEYAWVDQQQRIVRIPIGRAMKLRSEKYEGADDASP